MRVMDLHPGDKVRLPMGDEPKEAIFIASVSPLPLYPQLWMVVWRIIGHTIKDRFTHDALNPLQEIGEVVEPRDKHSCEVRLRFALHDDKRAGREMMNFEAQAKQEV